MPGRRFPLLPGASLTRRKLLHAVSGAGLLVTAAHVGFGASDFWNRKPSSEWSEDEVEQLKTKSPWVRKTRAEMSGSFAGNRRGGGAESMDRGGSPGTFGGMTGADSNGIGGGGGRGGGGRGGRGGGDVGGGVAAPQGPEVIVRWESAKAMLVATRVQLPEDLDNRYVISVTGLPPQMLAMLLSGGGRGQGQPLEDPAARQKAMIERLLHSATLSAKGRDSQSADLIRQSNGNQTLIFGFPKQSLPLAITDKDVQFLMKLGALTIKAKFEPKEMLYKGELSL